MLRLRQRRQCRHVPDGAREHHLSRSPEDGGQTIRHRGQGEGDVRGRGTPQRRPRIDVRAQRLGGRLFLQLPAPRDRGHERGYDLFPPEARHDRRHDQEVRPRVLPARGDRMSKDALAAGYKKEFLVSTGLSLERESDGSLYDRFRDRVIFPVHNISGRIVAFGGRTLRTDKTVAKYQNSPESEIYSKKRELYGLYFAKKAIQQLDFAIMVEGYTDVISMHQAGVENVVSSSGTSLTTEQIRLLNRFTKNITVIYDGDSAGIHASLRGIDMILREGMNVRVVLLPEPEDPDSFARAHTAAEVQEYIRANEQDFLAFKAKLLLEAAQGDPIRKAALIADMVQSIAQIPRSDPAVGLHQGVRADHGHRREHPDLGGGAQAHGDDRRPRGRRIRTPPDGVAEGGGSAARGGIREAGRGREQHRGARTRTGEIPAQIRPLFVRVQGGAHDGGVQRRGGDLPGTGQRRAYVLQSAIQQYFGNLP